MTEMADWIKRPRAWLNGLLALLLVGVLSAPVYMQFSAMQEMITEIEAQDREIRVLRRVLKKAQIKNDLTKKSTPPPPPPPPQPPPQPPSARLTPLPLPPPSTPPHPPPHVHTLLQQSPPTSSHELFPKIAIISGKTATDKTETSPDIPVPTVPAVTTVPVPARYSSIFQKLCKLNFKGIVEGGSNRCCKGMTESDRTSLVHDMAPFIALRPAAPFKTTSPPFAAKDRLDCHTSKWVGNGKIFTGDPRPANSVPLVIDLFIIGSEMDLLEVRLYELIESVDYVILGHSPHNHRGDAQPNWFLHARDRQGRFGDHADRIILIDVSKCDAHKKEITEHGNKRRQQEMIMDIQTTQRHCLWKLGVAELRKKLTPPRVSGEADSGTPPALPDNTLLVFADADELPDRELVYHLKHCSLQPTALPSHMRMRVQGHNFRVPCSDGINKHTGASEIAEWRTVKEDNGIIYRFRAPPSLQKRKKGHFNQAGIHMTWYGSMAFVDYKGFSHADPVLPVDADS